MPSTASSPVHLDSGPALWQRHVASKGVSAAAVGSSTRGSTRRHSWNELTTTSTSSSDKRRDGQEEKECSVHGSESESVSAGGSGNGSGSGGRSRGRGWSGGGGGGAASGPVVPVVRLRSGVSRRRRVRHTIGDATELRGSIVDHKAAAAAAQTELKEDIEDEPAHKGSGGTGAAQSSSSSSSSKVQLPWRSRQPPELPKLHLFPPSPTNSELAHEEAAAGEAEAGASSAAAADGQDSGAEADEEADEAGASSEDATGLTAAAELVEAASTAAHRSGSYRAAVPNMTLSFSDRSESMLQPDREQRYARTEAAIAAHHTEQQQREAEGWADAALPADQQAAAAAAYSSASASTFTASCCVAGPSHARCGDDVELLAAWRELLDEGEQVAAHWSSEDEVAACEAHFQAAVRTLAWRGIPHSIRQRAWLRLLRDKMPARDMDAYYALMQARVGRARQQHDEQQRRQAAGAEQSFAHSAAASPLWCSFADIEKDVNRTLPSLWLFRTVDGVDRLRRVLLAYCVHCPLVGYCQGLNFIAGSLLLVCEGDEVAAFSLLTAMVDSRSGYYSKSMAACMVDTAVLSDLCAYFEPELCALLSGHGLSLSNFCSSWLICLFCNTPLNVYDAFRVWDVLHVLGDEALFRCGLSLLRHAHSRIAATRSSEELMLLFLQQLGDVQPLGIEPVMQHMYAEWRAEPLLDHSIAALREYHRYEITAEHSTLPAATLVRLGDKVTFSEDELQRLWQIFIRPDPWLTISTQCIQSLVHFRYSFCAAVFHPDTSAQFKGRGLILPLNLHDDSTTAALPASTSASVSASASASGVAAAAAAPASPSALGDRGQSREATRASVERRASGCEVAAALSAQPAASELSVPLPRSITAFYNPNDIAGHEDEGGPPPNNTTTTATATSATTAAPSPSPPSVSPLSSLSSSTLSSSSSTSSRSARGGPSFLSHLTAVARPGSGGGMRSLASTFVIPSADDDTDSIFAHANQLSSSGSKPSYMRAKSQPNPQQQQPAQARAPTRSSKFTTRQQQQQQSSAPPQAELEADLSAFHAPSTSVPLSSPPMSPSSRSGQPTAASRVFAFAFSNSSTNDSAASINKRAATRSRLYGGGQPGGDSGSGVNGAASPHALPSFSAHRALLSATALLSTPAAATSPASEQYGRLTLQRSSLSSTLALPANSPLSAPYALYSATAHTTAYQLPLLTEAAGMTGGRQPFNSTSPLSSSLCMRDGDSGSISSSGDSPTTRQPSTSSSAAPHDHCRLPPAPCAAPASSLLSVSGVCGVVGGGTSSVYARSDNVLARLFSMLDSSSRGVVDFDEFCFGVCLFKRYPRKARLRAMFAMCDVAGEGQVSRADFHSFVGMFDRLYHGKRASDAELQAFVTAAFEKAAPSQFINCPLFEAIVPLHPAISTFFKLDSASD